MSTNLPKIFVAIAFVGALLSIKRRSKVRVILCKVSSNTIFQRFSRACARKGHKVKQCDDNALDFVWTSSRRSAFVGTRCWNRLCGLKCLEDKRLMGEVFSGETSFFLESHSISDVSKLNLWRSRIIGANSTKSWWVLKDARANGGTGLWFFDVRDDQQFSKLCEDVAKQKHQAGYTVQEYLPGRPMLWNKRKFHFRVGALLTADGRAFLHRVAFVHPANSVYTADTTRISDPSIHITNLCVNLNLNQPELFVGEIREDLIENRPQLWPKMLQLWSTVALRLRPFLRYQRSSLDFEYIGLDLIANEDEEVFLIEANCPPAVSSATGFAHAEAMHEEIIGDMFEHIVLRRIVEGVESEHAKCFGGWVECTPNYPFELPVTFVHDYKKAQAQCELVLMRFLNKRRKEQSLTS